MAKQIRIRNLKSIESLDFEMPGPGVHLLAGTNGAGKTTLLGCLRRLGVANAFQIHFPASALTGRLDDFTASGITYILDERSVTYAYAGERWVPRPRREGRLVGGFGYPNVMYAGATASRITPRPEDPALSRAKPAPQTLRDAANLIFDTTRFTELRTINLTTGNKNQAFVLTGTRHSTRGNTYISEKNFSLGELCVLKLLRELNNCKNGTLVLIDELELALHPRAQVGLIGYLERIAKEKSLTVIVSTHSVTLLKMVPRRQLLFLEKRKGSTAVIKGCFPAYALGNLSLSEERAPDIAIYVEDEASRTVMENLIKIFLMDTKESRSGTFPSVTVLPVGDFKNVVRFFDRNKAVLPNHVRQWIVLDKDVEMESLNIMAASSNNAMRDLFHSHQCAIRYLPWTPEVGLMQYFQDNRSEAQQKLREQFLNAHINLSAQMTTITSVNPDANQRSECKKLLKEIIQNTCEQTTGTTKESISDFAYKLFTEHFFNTQRQQVMEFIGPIIS